MTITLAGGTLPAAVICPVKNRPNSCAASTIARYPAMLAIELSASSDWAREIRGTESIAITLILRAASFSISCGFCAGQIKLISVVPGFSRAISSSFGALTLRMTSDCHTSSPVTISAPASAKASSSKLASFPAPLSTATLKPSLSNCSTVFGVAAARVSWASLSCGTPIRIVFPSIGF